MKKIGYWSLIIMFILFLLYPSIASLLGVSPNRYTVAPSRKKFPKLENYDIFKYFSDFEEFYSEKFNGRSLYYRSLSTLKYNLFGTSAKHESVLVGNDGFLFLGNNASNIVNETIGLDLFSDEEMNRVEKRMLQALNWMNKGDIKFYMVIGPNKHTIYPEKLPFKVNPDRMTKIDQVAEIVNGIENVRWIGLEENLITAKKHGLLYHKTDTHWNTLGGYFAYRQIMKALNEDFPSEFKPMPLSYMERFGIEKTVFGLTRMLDYPINETTNDVKVLNVRSRKAALQLNMKHRRDAEMRFTAPKKKRKAVIIRDSYSIALVDFLKEHFKEVVFIWTPKLNRDMILAENPDIVIYEVVERNVDLLLNL